MLPANAASTGQWRLPPVALLKRTKAAEVDRRMVEALGHTLEDALAAHGVETRLVGMTVGPTVTRFELELGAGVKVAKVTNLQRDIAYAMAAAGRAHPGADPGPLGHRRRGAQPAASAGDRWATSSPPPRPMPRPTRSKWLSGATSPGDPCWRTWPTMPHI